MNPQFFFDGILVLLILIVFLRTTLFKRELSTRLNSAERFPTPYRAACRECKRPLKNKNIISITA
jgi:hypothetical protein